MNYTKKILLLSFVLMSFLFANCKTTKTSAVSNAKNSQHSKTSSKYDAAEEEYKRSIRDIKGAPVSRQDFEDDKKQILEIIKNLASVMNQFNYTEWTKFIEPSSISYWQNARNLAAASQRLPASVRSQLQGARLRTLRDYFSHVFVPARKGRTVDEIRYLSKNSVKAVEVENNLDVIYYNFVKINGKWLVHLPPNER